MSKVAVVYWSGTGNTEAMASAVVDGVREDGAEAELLRLPSLMRQCSPLLTLWRSDVRQWAANSLRTASSSLCLIRARVISEAKNCALRLLRMGRRRMDEKLGGDLHSRRCSACDRVGDMQRRSL